MGKIIKAELWDKMQYMFRNYYDRMVHGAFYYDKLVDTDVLGNILIGFMELNPVLRSRFVPHPVSPYWETASYTLNDILTVKNVEPAHLEESIDDFITGVIPVDSNVQIKVAVFNAKGRSALAILVNHMCFDGGDFKYFLYTLVENYNNIKNGLKEIIIKRGSRSYDAVYSKFDEREKKIANKLYKNISTVKDKHYFPFTADSEADINRIVRRKIDKELFKTFRATGKRMNVTVNDLILTVYMRSLYEIGNFDDHAGLTIPCMVDLRRHIAGGDSVGGLTNHTGFMQCSLKRKGATINDTLLQVLKSTRKNKRDKYLGLYSLPLLKLAYTIFPYTVSEFTIMKGYINPLIGMSNIGLLDHRKLDFVDANIVDGFITGAVKYKPYMQLALTTLHGEVSMTIAMRCNEEDVRIIENFFDLMIKNIEEFNELNK
ncbi:MAG: hypothetical protein WAO23_06655 [Dethiobacteria bacterium]